MGSNVRAGGQLACRPPLARDLVHARAVSAAGNPPSPQTCSAASELSTLQPLATVFVNKALLGYSSCVCLYMSCSPATTELSGCDRHRMLLKASKCLPASLLQKVYPLVPEVVSGEQTSCPIFLADPHCSLVLGSRPCPPPPQTFLIPESRRLNFPSP